MQKLINEFIEDQRLEGKAGGTLREYKQRLEEIETYLNNKNLTIRIGHKSLGMTAHYAQSALVDLSDITPEI